MPNASALKNGQQKSDRLIDDTTNQARSMASSAFRIRRGLVGCEQLKKPTPPNGATALRTTGSCSVELGSRHPTVVPVNNRSEGNALFALAAVPSLDGELPLPQGDRMR